MSADWDCVPPPKNGPYDTPKLKKRIKKLEKFGKKQHKKERKIDTKDLYKVFGFLYKKEMKKKK